MSQLWMALLASVLFIVVGIASLPEGGIFWGVRIPAWCEVLLIILGFIVGSLSLQGILRRRKNPGKYAFTDEDAAKAKAKLDAMYLEEHGVLPNPSPVEPEKHRIDEAAGDKP